MPLLVHQRPADQEVAVCQTTLDGISSNDAGVRA